MKITVVDLETDNVNPEIANVMEVGIATADLDTGAVDLVFESLVCPPTLGWDDCWFMQHSLIDRKNVLEAPAFELIKPQVAQLLSAFPVTAYNLGFDLRIIYRHHISVEKQFPCLMQTCTPILRLPPYRNGSYKFPKFAEAWSHFFPNTVLNVTHRAGVDAVNEGKLAVTLARRGYFAKQIERWSKVNSES